LAALAWLGLSAVPLARGDSVSFDARQALDEVIAGRSSLTDARITEMHDALQAVRSGSPNDPTIPELMGVLDVRRSDSWRYAKEIDEHFLRAIELRPSSAYTWAAIAGQRYRAGDTGPGFEKVLLNAAALGPNEPAVQSTVVNFGLAVWDDLSGPARAATEGMLARGMNRNPSEMLQISERRGRLAMACRHLDGRPRQVDARWIETCQRMEATS
jgi:hypothetical protein